MDPQPDMTDLRRRLAEIQELLRTDLDATTERVSKSGLAHALSDVFGFMDELAVAVEGLQSQIRP